MKLCGFVGVIKESDHNAIPEVHLRGSYPSVVISAFDGNIACAGIDCLIGKARIAAESALPVKYDLHLMIWLYDEVIELRRVSTLKTEGSRVGLKERGGASEIVSSVSHG